MHYAADTVLLRVATVVTIVPETISATTERCVRRTTRSAWQQFNQSYQSAWWPREINLCKQSWWKQSMWRDRTQHTPRVSTPKAISISSLSSLSLPGGL